MAGEKVVKNGIKIFTQTGMVLCNIASRMRKKERNGPCSYDRVHPFALQDAYQWFNQCEHIYFKSGLGNMLIERYTSLSQE